MFDFNNIIEIFLGFIFAFLHNKFLKKCCNLSDNCVEKFENCFCNEDLMKKTGFISINRIRNKFIGDQINNRITSKVKKIRYKVKNNKSDETERDITINTEYSNKNDNSMISITMPQNSLFERPMQINNNNINNLS